MELIGDRMNSIIQFISDYGLAAMFLIIMLEYACFPVSSEIVLPFSGAMAFYKDIPFFIIILTSVIAGTIGTCFCYAVGRYGGTALLDRIKRRFPKTQKGIDNSYEKFNRYGNYAVCFGRMIPICRTYIAFIAGAAKQPIHAFISYSFLGITIWNILLIGIGYYLSDNWKQVLAYYDKYEIVILPTVIVLVLLLVRSKLKKSACISSNSNI